MKTSPRYVVLDDDLFALAIATNIIRNHCRRAQVVGFSTCKEAIAYMEAYHSKGKYPDTVLLMDLHMPDTDGFALLDRMENIWKATRGNLHIFVLSGAASPDEIRRVLAYSCVTGFYPKPFSDDKLSHIITCVQYPL